MRVALKLHFITEFALYSQGESAGLGNMDVLQVPFSELRKMKKTAARMHNAAQM